MAQVTRGLYAVLSMPFIYTAFQNLMGAQRGWADFVRDFVKPSIGGRLLDVGCGPGELLSYLPEMEYWGFDISEAYIEYARGKFGARGNFVCKLLVAEDLATMPRFDVVVASGVLRHMDDDVARDFVALSHAALKPGGRFVTVDPCWTDHQHPVARFLISRDRGRNVRTAIGYEQLVSPVFRERKITVRHKAWVPYTHCFMECVRG